jgi:hypothetical protein
VGGKDGDSLSEESEEAKGLRQWYRAKTSPESNSGSFAPFPSGPFVTGSGEGSNMALYLNTERHLHQLLDANGDLTHTNRLAYRETLSRILTNMPPAAHKAIHDTVKRISAFNNLKNLRDYSEQNRGRTRPVLGGYWDSSQGLMVVDGGKRKDGDSAQTIQKVRDIVYAHELTHAIDSAHRPRISDSLEWKAAWEEEINNDSSRLC